MSFNNNEKKLNEMISLKFNIKSFRQLEVYVNTAYKYTDEYLQSLKQFDLIEQVIKQSTVN